MDYYLATPVTSSNLPLFVFNFSGVELPDVVLSLAQTECLLNVFQAPYTTQNKINQTISRTTEKDTGFVASLSERGKPLGMIRSR